MESDVLAGYWWDKITSADTFVNETVNALREGKVPVLLVPNDLPWREPMRFVIQNHITEQCAGLGSYTIDIHDENADEMSPGRFMLQKLTDTKYRPGSDLTIQQHILNNGLINGKLLWIKGLSASNADSWLKFCDGFRIERREKGMIVIEMPFDKSTSSFKNLKPIRYEQIIREYAVQLFVEHVLDDGGYDGKWRKYLSMLISTLCKKDVEVACDLAKDYKLKTERIEDALKKLSARKEYARRGNAENHILNLVRNEKTELINKLIWTAQMQVLFPMLEMERVQWVARYRTQIQKILSTHVVTVVGSKDRVSDPNEIEFRHLKEFYSWHYLDQKFDEKRKNRLELLYNCRNSLAHLHPCKHEWVYALLNSDCEDFLS